MSYYEEQEDAWFENDCKGSIEDYDPHDPDSWPGKKWIVEPNREEKGVLNKLKKATDGKRLKCSYHGNGHYQIRAGRKIINWYPLSKRQTAYNNITGEKRFGLTIDRVVEFALESYDESKGEVHNDGSRKEVHSN